MGKHKDQLQIDLDRFAAALIKQATGSDPDLPVSIDQKGAVFEKVCRWVMIKNKLQEMEPDGAGIAELKRRTKGAVAEPDGNSTHAERVANYAKSKSGAGLTSLKRSLPATDDGGALSGRLHALREVSSTPRNGRGRDIGLSGNDRTDDAQTGGDGDL